MSLLGIATATTCMGVRVGQNVEIQGDEFGYECDVLKN